MHTRRIVLPYRISLPGSPVKKQWEKNERRSFCTPAWSKINNARVDIVSILFGIWNGRQLWLFHKKFYRRQPTRFWIRCHSRSTKNQPKQKRASQQEELTSNYWQLYYVDPEESNHKQLTRLYSTYLFIHIHRKDHEKNEKAKCVSTCLFIARSSRWIYNSYNLFFLDQQQHTCLYSSSS